MIVDVKTNQNMCYFVNSAIFLLVLLMMAIYDYIGATFLAIYSIFVAAVYLVNYIFIYKLKLRAYIWATYAMLTLYMPICTIMLGYNYGFHLYSLSTIPLIFYVKYISVKLKMKDPKPGFWTVLIIIACVVSSIYTVAFGPIYKIDGYIPIIFLGINAFSVCLFLYIFSKRMIVLVIDSEGKLEIQANYDALTKLPNRYYMRNVLINSIENHVQNSWIAMIDIDKFKRINDTYGHNIGDEVLKQLGMIMNQVCKGCTVSRWGGEEFLIYGEKAVVDSVIIGKLRAAVEEFSLSYNGEEIKFTITAGVAAHMGGQPMDKWIITADNRLYYGKENGRNRVIYE